MENPTLRALAVVSAIVLGAVVAPDAAAGQQTRAAGDISTTVYAPQNRPDVRGTNGAVSAGHPLAAQAGLAVLQRGGTATDAIIAMAGVLAVVRPHMNGVGGDAFAIFYDGATSEISAINGSGRAGRLATPGFFREQGVDRVPGSGALSVTVPGAVAAWVDAHERFGTLPFDELLEPGIRLAGEGFPVSKRLAYDIESGAGRLNEAARALYLPGGSAPPVGSLLKNEALAATLREIAKSGKESFYAGALAERLAGFIESEGGHLRTGDFRTHRSTWVEPLRADYLGLTFLVMPPNSQGLAQLSYMGLAEAHPIRSLGHNTTAYLHTMIELKKLAFADRDRWVADPAQADIPIAELLDKDYLRERAASVNPGRAAAEVPAGIGEPVGEVSAVLNDAGDTVYLTAVDRYGNAVSWIQSLFAGFGSGLLDPGTGVVFHNRGSGHSLIGEHPNVVAPDKRPYHTLTPMMALREDGSFALAMGTPGGDSQTQSLLQIVHNLLVFGMTPQEAIEAPRFRSSGGRSVSIEDRIAPGVLAELEALGHELRVIEGWTATFGGAQMIYVEPGSGTFAAAADPRREAYALAY
ncbi:MAG: gamma-glutamyltransferase [Gammaproteobacteria bacterium]|nr:gamma-glutamyltransferase [Gammaproteobacteria bacterium]